MTGFFIFFLIFSFIIISSKVILNYFQTKEKNYVLKQIADILNLSLNNSIIKGIYQNNNIEINYEKKNGYKIISVEIFPKNGMTYFELKKNNHFFRGFDSNNEFTTGDDRFDYSYIISSNQKKRTYALLNSTNRNLLKKYLWSYPFFKITNISIKLSIYYFDSVKTVISEIMNLLNLSDNLLIEESTEEILKKNILNFENDGIYRIRCLVDLLNMEDNEKDCDFYKKLQSDHENEIVFLTSQKLGENGLQRLISLFFENDIKLSVRILTYLKNNFNNQVIVSLLGNILNSKEFNKITLYVRFLNDIGYDKLPNEIFNLLDNKNLMESFPELCIEIIIIFGRLKIEKSIQFLIDKLKSGNIEIILSTLESIRLFDKIEFVEHILPLTEGLNSPVVKQKALKTIDELQKNVSKDMKGTLSVVDISSEEGNLSIIDDDGDGGKLSLK